MTEASFLSWYPQFESFTPAFVLRETVSRANGMFAGMEPEDAEAITEIAFEIMKPT